MNLPDRDHDLDLLLAYADGQLPQGDVDELMLRLKDDAALRSRLRRVLSVDAHLMSIMDRLATEDDLSVPHTTESVLSRRQFLWGAAACIWFMSSLGTWWITMSTNSPHPNEGVPALTEGVDEPMNELSKEIFAVVESSENVIAFQDSNPVQLTSGSVLGNEVIHIKKGVIHIEFFCGASVVLEGPAHFEINSAWEAFCHQGKVWAKVPPAARGFVINTHQSKVVDLGTEFGLQVEKDQVNVQVFDGTIRLDHHDNTSSMLNTGEALVVEQFRPQSSAGFEKGTFNDHFGTQKRQLEKIKDQYEAWEGAFRQLKTHPHLMAAYDMDVPPDMILHNRKAGISENHITRGKVILAKNSYSRWGQSVNAKATEFKTPGSRVRMKIPGTFQAITFAAWVRIDSLNKQFNALFMTDSFEQNEPHWQLDRKGHLSFTIMKNEKLFKKQLNDQGKLNDYSYHTPYKTPHPVWSEEQRGTWKFLATTYDPKNKKVTHYLDGKLNVEFDIPEGDLLQPLIIGNAELGNWGNPIGPKKTVIRTLNGVIDDFMVFDCSLSAVKIQEIYELSRVK